MWRIESDRSQTVEFKFQTEALREVEARLDRGEKVTIFEVAAPSWS